MRHGPTLRLALLGVPVVCLAALAAALATAAQAASSVSQRTTTLFVVRSSAIDEDSGLVRSGSRFVTTNDSGDSGRVFTLNNAGRTVGVTHWAKHPLDCEALAPAPDGRVWVADIGDNNRRRPSVTIVKVPVGKGSRTVHPPHYRLVYPSGPANAETLVRNPVTGRLYIATKDAAGGELYAVPRHLSRKGTNLLKPVAPVIATATDGSFVSDGDYLVIRNYTQAEVYAWPSMSSVGTFALPIEQQGEGLAAGGGGSVFLSSEGVRQPVLEFRLPRALRRVITAASRGAGAEGSRARHVALVGG